MSNTSSFCFPFCLVCISRLPLLLPSASHSHLSSSHNEIGSSVSSPPPSPRVYLMFGYFVLVCYRYRPHLLPRYFCVSSPCIHRAHVVVWSLHHAERPIPSPGACRPGVSPLHSTCFPCQLCDSLSNFFFSYPSFHCSWPDPSAQARPCSLAGICVSNALTD